MNLASRLHPLVPVLLSPHPLPRPLAGLLLGVLGACASYNQRTEHALRAFERGRFETARVAYTEDAGDHFLPWAEGGMVALVAGDWDRARDHLTAAAAAVEAVEREALVSPENAGEQLLSWTLNETFREYMGEGYERVMLHVCLGLAYLTRGEVEDVLVEVRLANRLLEAEQELYDADYRAGGLGHFLSAVAYELVGDLDDAYIDYKRMEAKGVGGELTGRALVRLATWLGRDDELPRWVERHGPDVERPADAASVVLIAGVGLGPYKQEERLDLPTPEGLLSWAVPSFRARPQAVSSLVLSTPTTRVRSEVVEDVARVADRNLSDRIAWLAAKSTVRAFLKRELSRSLAEEHGGAGWVAGAFFSLLTERADLRAWRTLPDTWQAARLFLTPGEHRLELHAAGGERADLGVFALESGETMFVLARTLRTRLYAHPIGGRPVPAGATSTEPSNPEGEPR